MNIGHKSPTLFQLFRKGDVYMKHYVINIIYFPFHWFTTSQRYKGIKKNTNNHRICIWMQAAVLTREPVPHICHFIANIHHINWLGNTKRTSHKTWVVLPTLSLGMGVSWMMLKIIIIIYFSLMENSEFAPSFCIGNELQEQAQLQSSGHGAAALCLRLTGTPAYSGARLKST